MIKATWSPWNASKPQTPSEEINNIVIPSIKSSKASVAKSITKA